MGQKVHPVGFRVGVTAGWDSQWYAEKNYRVFIEEDLKIRAHIRNKLANAGISKVVIERTAAQKADRKSVV